MVTVGKAYGAFGSDSSRGLLVFSTSISSASLHFCKKAHLSLENERKKGGPHSESDEVRGTDPERIIVMSPSVRSAKPRDRAKYSSTAIIILALISATLGR